MLAAAVVLACPDTAAAPAAEDGAAGAPPAAFDSAVLSLEEQAARHDALGQAPRPDVQPLVAVEPVLGVGAILPDGGFEHALYVKEDAVTYY